MQEQVRSSHPNSIFNKGNHKKYLKTHKNRPRSNQQTNHVGPKQLELSNWVAQPNGSKCKTGLRWAISIIYWAVIFVVQPKTLGLTAWPSPLHILTKKTQSIQKV